MVQQLAFVSSASEVSLLKNKAKFVRCTAQADVLAEEGAGLNHVVTTSTAAIAPTASCREFLDGSDDELSELFL